MVKLLIIADDFTGALDTGVRFSGMDVQTAVCPEKEDGIRKILRSDAQVIVLDTESRHLNAREAYRIVFRVTKIAAESGITHFYKKTDSGMRGNIGSELAAVLEAAGEERIHFLPAFPELGRTTENGIHYIDGIPAAESAYGKDPIDPVLGSSVREILEGKLENGQRGLVPVHAALKHAAGENHGGICVYDSTTDEEMAAIGKELKDSGSLRLLAGCAGFAKQLPELLELEKKPVSLPDLSGGLLAVCGSINPVTLAQETYAAREGCPREFLAWEQETAPMQKADDAVTAKPVPGWETGTPGMAEPTSSRIAMWTDLLRRKKRLIICSREGKKEGDIPDSPEKTGKKIARRLGQILREMLDEQLRLGERCTVFVTGGDTLLACMQQLGIYILFPRKELFPGVVLTQFTYRGTDFALITKSGGFGSEDLLFRLGQMTAGCGEEKKHKDNQQKDNRQEDNQHKRNPQ